MDFDTQESIYSDSERQTLKHKGKFFLLGFAFLVVLLMVAVKFTESLEQPPISFRTGEDIVIAEGTTVSNISRQFAEAGFVKSDLYFYLVLLSSFRNEFVQAGSYRFTEPLTVHKLGEAITRGEYIVPPISITFPEGFKVADMHKYLPDSYAGVDVTVALPYEGYLFPDTYFITPETSLNDIISLMQENFVVKTKPLQNRIESSTLNSAEIVILASILEREGNDPESMKMISGILQKRLEIGMPLQVDATLDYLLGKASHELTEEDLDIDSPYNTYNHNALPPGPISNPGLTALTAALEPTPSRYLYYLTGDDGVFYYARTFDEHKLNKARYLK